VEIAFISNPQEEKLLKNNEFSQKAAQALFDAISYYIENIPNEM
jgi:N-acetylmuramoyl-L-alanine amidase